MHWPTLAGTKRRTRRPSASSRRAALKNWLTWNGTSRSGAHSATDWNSRLHRRWCGPDWSLIHRTRSSLRNNHARCRRRRRRWPRCDRRRRRCTRRNRRRSSDCYRGRLTDRLRRNGRRSDRANRRRTRPCRSGRCGNSRSRWNWWRDWAGRNRCCGWRNRRSRRGRSNHRRRDRCGTAHRSRRSCHKFLWSWRWRRSHYRSRRDWGSHCFFFLGDRAQHVPGTGNVRQIDFGFDFFFAAAGAGTGFARLRRAFRRADIHSNLFRFVLFQRTGVRLLFSHSDQRKRIKNRLTLDFQLSGKIVNSNLTHPAFRFSAF